ncbi:LysM peptidoglycan-binding domain-containing protein [Flavobacterium sp.]|uniref:LysM peptidoglycan-binding domain-containing protein n=1 Tax=Flavobacterium sp. TaxID=239 RepID=UPI002613D38A|nr:LysM peptidoglycan-binding domain-containing protein [Flavobacterium sp.]MDD3004301.1 LysM peptidoglycan-binding domain-containing protein [Flavobacterium sp.]
MNTRKLVLATALMITGTIFSQDSLSSQINKPIVKISFLDSIKASFVHDEVAACVDSLWMKELTNQDIFTELSNDIATIDLDKKVDYELSTELLKERLKEMDAKSPFNIQYNPALENLIKSFLKNRKKSFERLMAISEYYFPVFEEALAKQNVPLEIKYLSIVESALNPKAVSRVGATGLWQFMYQTGKEYNLHIDSFVDERSDPLKSSRAATQYMTNMYRIFGDWELVLASYNSGAGNVAKAIRRSGGQQNYWNIRKHLPKETQGYVPAFLATMYIYEYHKEHGIKPNRAPIKHFETDTVMIKREMSFKQIADLMDIPVSQIQLMNPSYKMNVVPFYPNKPHYLRLPKDKIAVFTSNEDKIYAYVEYQSKKIEMPYFVSNIRLASNDTLPKTNVKTKYHTVKRGESLGLVSNKYGVTVSDLKRWNNLKSNTINSGKRLKIQMNSIPDKIVAPKEVPQVVEKQESVVASTENTTPESTSENEVVVYTVQKGDNLSSIARKFNITVAELKELNHLEDTNVKLDSKLKVVKSNAVATVEKEIEKKDFVNYTVVKGDNLGNIAKRYNVSVASLQEWNELKDNNVQIGKQLLILSDSKPTNVSKSENVAHYLVKKGDSLFKIAQKYPGVTVADIKKWNGINGNELKPGMKLKISS